MIYIKRFCFVLITLVCILLAIFGTMFLIATSPIWGVIYYVITGEDPINDEIFCVWEFSIHIMDKFRDKFGLNDELL